MDKIELRNEKTDLLKACLRFKATADKLNDFLNKIDSSRELSSPLIWVSLNLEEGPSLLLDEELSKKVSLLLIEAQEKYEKLFDSYDIIKKDEKTND